MTKGKYIKFSIAKLLVVPGSDELKELEVCQQCLLLPVGTFLLVADLFQVLAASEYNDVLTAEILIL